MIYLLQTILYVDHLLLLLTRLVEDESIDSYVFLTNIYDDISNELKRQLDDYFKNYTEGQFTGTSYENSKLFDVLKALVEKSKKIVGSYYCSRMLFKYI